MGTEVEFWNGHIYVPIYSVKNRFLLFEEQSHKTGYMTLHVHQRKFTVLTEDTILDQIINISSAGYMTRLSFLVNFNEHVHNWTVEGALKKA